MYLIFDTQEEVSRYTAQLVYERLQNKPDITLGLATGSTMERIYAELVTLLQQKPMDLAQITTFNLDEYVGLGRSHPQSYYYYMFHHLFNYVDIPAENIHLPNGKAPDLEAECKRYNELCRQQPTDLQLLGVGTNGHIAFNEPGTSFESITHVVALTKQTRIDNSRFFSDPSEMPHEALTMGFQEIMNAKEITLVVTGKHKAEIVEAFHYSTVTETLPVSVLKKHPHYTVIFDREAASLLPVEATSPTPCIA